MSLFQLCLEQIQGIIPVKNFFFIIYLFIFFLATSCLPSQCTRSDLTQRYTRYYKPSCIAQVKIHSCSFCESFLNNLFCRFQAFVIFEQFITYLRPSRKKIKKRKKEPISSVSASSQFQLSDQTAAFPMGYSTLSDTFMLPSQQGYRFLSQCSNHLQNHI